MKLVIPKTPAEDAVQRLSVPLGCGYKGHEDIVFGVSPFPEGRNMQKWEYLIQSHFVSANHKRIKFREIK